MTSLRWLLLLAAAAILPSCGDHRDKWLWVTVDNQGTVSADVWAEADYVQAMGVWSDETEVSVAPNESVKFGMRFESMSKLTIVVHRSTDQEVLFYDSWDFRELDHLHGYLALTIYP